MNKVTRFNVNSINIGDIIAKYPISGDICNDLIFNENDVSDNIYYLVVETISPTFEYVLACSILGFGVQITGKLTQTRQDLENGYWWLNISLQDID